MLGELASLEVNAKVAAEVVRDNEAGERCAEEPGDCGGLVFTLRHDGKPELSKPNSGVSARSANDSTFAGTADERMRKCLLNS